MEGASGLREDLCPVLSWEYCICVMLCILFQTYENGGLGPVLGIRWRIINGPERSSQCYIFRHTSSKRLVWGQPQLYLFAVTVLSFPRIFAYILERNISPLP